MSGNSTPKYYPRGQDSQYANSPNSTNKSPGGSRFSTQNKSAQFSPSRSVVGQEGTLLVDGVGKSPAKYGGATSVFRSSTTTADAHIKALGGRYQSSGGSFNSKVSGGTAAFRSSSPSDRDSHIKDLSNRTYAAGGSSRSNSPNSSRQLGSASFRSNSPNACAHIKAMNKPVDASYSHTGKSSRAATSWTRSNTSIADAHIKAMNKPHEGSTGLLSPGGSRGATNVFRSNTTIADAHIKAMIKPVDQLVSYRDIQEN